MSEIFLGIVGLSSLTVTKLTHGPEAEPKSTNRGITANANAVGIQGYLHADNAQTLLQFRNHRECSFAESDSQTILGT